MSLVNVLTPGMVVVDVGANVGSLTSQYQQVGAEVFAIEPDPRCWKELSRHVDAEHLIGMAVGDHEGVLQLFRSVCPAHNSIALANLVEPGIVPALHVPLTTLDELQAQGRLPAKIDAIKVDVQGAETTIVRGASRIIATQHPLWFVEFWPDGLTAAGTSLNELCDVYEAHGYQPEGHSWAYVRTWIATMTGHSSHDLLLRAS